MSCGCGKKKGAPVIYNQDVASGDPKVWGPALWSCLHIIAEHVGKREIDIAEARDFEIVITMLPQVIPCAHCQAHAKTYLSQYPFEANKNAKVPGTLGPYAETWLLTFHNAVRTQNSQPIEVSTLEQLRALYKGRTIQKSQIDTIVANVNYGIRNALIKLDAWKRWYSIFSRLKIISGS
jgi:Erv1 / Alr family